MLALDPENPQVASRLTHRVPDLACAGAGRRGRAEAALRRIAAPPNLSRDVSDIVQRALADDVNCADCPDASDLSIALNLLRYDPDSLERESHFNTSRANSHVEKLTKNINSRLSTKSRAIDSNSR